MKVPQSRLPLEPEKLHRSLIKLMNKYIHHFPVEAGEKRVKKCILKNHKTFWHNRKLRKVSRELRVCEICGMFLRTLKTGKQWYNLC